MTALALANVKPSKTFADTRYPAAADKTFYPGAWVCLNSSGYLIPATTGAGLRSLGRCAERATVATTGLAAGAVTILVETGIGKTGGRRVFPILSAAAPNNIAQTDVGTNVYMLDDQTGTTDSSGNSIMGEVTEIDADGVIWCAPPLSPPA
jgi:hypothetical protein